MSKARNHLRNFGKPGRSYRVSSSSTLTGELRSAAVGGRSRQERVVTGPSITSDTDVKYVLVYQKAANYEKPSFAR